MTQGQPDPAVVRRHLAALREALMNLRRHTGVSAAELSANADLRWTIERGLQLCLQNALDIATHVAAACGLDAPDYSRAIERLAELGLLSAEFAARLRPIAGFRNVLVHGYLQVDQEIVASVVNERLGDLEEFAGCVESYLERL
ncbi:MAG: DUF86 domain-containing protein [Betaproteobacteria bacterium]|nr:DUF86 domain-containing protein [Betaproteobacteria bacterium]MBI2960046.1 DUF86 domain-containing protein [Betaproteobacteria bacterium]